MRKSGLLIVEMSGFKNRASLSDSPMAQNLALVGCYGKCNIPNCNIPNKVPESLHFKGLWEPAGCFPPFRRKRREG
jgi:hypothetical protein